MTTSYITKHIWVHEKYIWHNNHESKKQSRTLRESVPQETNTSIQQKNKTIFNNVLTLSAINIQPSPMHPHTHTHATEWNGIK